GTPLFVKPANQGSSVGVSKVANEAQYQQAVALAGLNIAPFYYTHPNESSRV
ncbi:hypothetical protein DBK40_12820, partial [Salmonella enterica subsp. enterica serovar Typhi]